MGKTKKRNCPLPVRLAGAAAVSLAVYLAGHLILAGVMVRGLAGEELAFPATAVLCALASFAGGLWAAGTLRALPAAPVMTAALFGLVLVVCGALWRGGFVWSSRCGVLLLCALCGGCGAGLTGNRRRKGRRKVHC